MDPIVKELRGAYRNIFMGLFQESSEHGFPPDVLDVLCTIMRACAARGVFIPPSGAPKCPNQQHKIASEDHPLYRCAMECLPECDELHYSLSTMMDACVMNDAMFHDFLEMDLLLLASANLNKGTFRSMCAVGRQRRFMEYCQSKEDPFAALGALRQRYVDAGSSHQGMVEDMDRVVMDRIGSHPTEADARGLNVYFGEDRSSM